MLIQTDGAAVLASLLVDIKTKLETKFQEAVQVYQVGMKPKIVYQKLLKWISNSLYGWFLSQ